LINPNVIAQRSELAAQFRSAHPFQHVTVENFFDGEFCAQLLADFPSFEDRYALNEMGQVGGKAVRMQVRDLSDAYRQLDAYLQSADFLTFVSEVTGIPDLLYDPEYIGGGTHENRHGQTLDAHVDFNYHPGTRWHRRLNLIVYLNPEWEAIWGGNLELHSDPWDVRNNRKIDIVPLMNRAVIFETTENSWHGFTPINLPESRRGISRKSFAIYLYTKHRPAELTAASHATVYVPESLPTEIVAGTTLSQEQVQQMHARFDGMLGQIKFLYQREIDFNTQIAALEGAINEARATQKIELQGYATQPEGVRGCWPDGWVAKRFGFVFVPIRAIRSVKIELWVPTQIGAGQQLIFDINGARFSHTVKAGALSTVDLPAKFAAGQRIELQIEANHDWQPSATDVSADQRALAFKLMSLVLEH